MSSIDSDYETNCSCPKFGARLLETCTSGLFSPSQPRRYTSFLVRLPLFFAPIFLSLPFLSLLEAPIGLTQLYPYLSLAYGFLITTLVTSFHSIIWIVNRRNRVSTADITATTQHSPTSEWIVFFTSLFPDRGHFINIPIQGLLSGILCGTALAALLPSQLTGLFGHSWPLFYLLGWLTVSLAQLNLTTAPPIETAIPVEQSANIIRAEFLTRPTHALFFLTLAVILTHFSTVTALIFYSFLFVTPLLWLFGLLPPFNQFIPLLAERSNILLFASTALTSRLFSVLLCLIWWTLVSIISLIACDIAALALLGSASYFLSLNLFGWLLAALFWVLSFLPLRTSEFLSSSLPFKPYFVRKREFIFSLKPIISVVVRFVLFPLSCLSLLSISHLGAFLSLSSPLCQHRLYTAYNCSIQVNSTANHTNTPGIYLLFQIPTFFYLFIAYGLTSPLLLIACYFLSVAQRRTFLFSLLNNQFYPTNLYNELDFNSGIQKNCLFRVSSLSIRVLRDFVSRMLSLSFLGFFLYSSRNSCTPSLLFNISVARSLHLAWRAPLRLSFEITIAVFIDLLLLNALPWMSLSVGVHLLIIGASVQYLMLFISKLRVILSYLGWYMVTEQSAHLTYLPEERGHLTCVSILLLPFTLLFLLPLSSLLSLTLLPLFTLPVFFPTYPHSSSYWSPQHRHSSWSGKDAVFYEQACSEVCRVFRQLVTRGVVLSPSPGQVYLLRFEDRIIFLTVNEVGYEYLCVSYKGLELTATSCHEIEATKFDDILEKRQTKQSVLTNIFNKYFLHLITPISHSVIDTYSEAQSSLRPITNSKTTIQKCREYFPKCLSWLIIREIIERERNNKNVYSKKKIRTQQTDNTPTIHTAVTTVIASPLTSTSIAKNESMTVSDFRQVWSTGFSNERHTPDSLFTEDLESLPDVSMFEDNLVNTSNTELDNNTERSSHPFKSQEKQLNNSPNNPAVARSLFPTSWTDLPISSMESAESVELVLLHKFCSHWRDQNSILLQEGDWNQIIFLVHRITTCVSSVVHPSSSDQSLNKLTGTQVCKNFCGNFQWSEGLSWLSNIPDLFNLATKAYRYTLKLILDEFVLMLDSTDECLVESLLELDTDWYLGSISEDSWKQQVLQGTPHILLLSQNSSRTKYYSHMLTLKPQLIHIAGLQPESLRAVWSSQLFELLYLKNAEEERYSNQQEEHFFRNITTQAGDAPVGYPVFSSAPIYT